MRFKVNQVEGNIWFWLNRIVGLGSEVDRAKDKDQGFG